MKLILDEFKYYDLMNFSLDQQIGVLNVYFNYLIEFKFLNEFNFWI